MLRGLGVPYAGFGVLALTVSCTSAEPTAPAQDGETVTEVVLAVVTDEDALSIDDMLSDALFQASVASVSDGSLGEPLFAAVDALARGQIGRAGPLIRKASDEADALLDDASADFDTLISWSVIERYFEEAELL